MKAKPIHTDSAGSRYLALQRLARTQKRPTAELLQLYILEGFLRRLVHSSHADTLVLKGGLLLAAFALRRATRDVDVLALRTSNDPDSVRRMVQDICEIDVGDGIVFLADTAAAAVIRDDDVYPGIRATLDAQLSTAKLKLSVDVNVGDPVVPGPLLTAIPALLDSATIEVLAYSKEMVVAEKLVTALQRGRANTRWRDFADLFMLLRGDLDEQATIRALQVVAKHRRTSLRPVGVILDGMAEEAQSRWAIWYKRQGLADRVPLSFGEVVRNIDGRTRVWLAG